MDMLYSHFFLEYAIRRVQVIQDSLKLKGTHQLLVYADNVIILGGSVHTIKENAVALVVASKETVLEVNADKNKYMVTSRDQYEDLIIVPLKGWKSSNIWEQLQQIKILFRKKLRAN